jgi:hypothetical protein
MKKNLLFLFLFFLGIGAYSYGQDIDFSIEIIQSVTNVSNSDIKITLNNGTPNFDVYLFDHDSPLWKREKAIKLIKIESSLEGSFENIPTGKYYIVVEDVKKNVAIKQAHVQ